MTAIIDSHKGPPRENGFGLVRLLLASAVIAGHAPELLDGNRLREPLTRLFGTLSLAELAVNGFFLISGFLVTGSWLRSAGAADYLGRRLVRLYPGFLVAFALSVFLVAPLAGGSLVGLGPAWWFRMPTDAMTLALPDVPGSFAGLAVPSLNGAMWTIALELRCYLLVVLLGWTGILARPWRLAFAAILCFTLHALISRSQFDAFKGSILVREAMVDPYSFTRLSGHFIVGALLLRVWPAGRASWSTAALAAAGLACGLSVPSLAEPASSLFGGVLLLALARAPLGWVRRIGERTDISYGLYLYAWPVMSLMILFVPKVAPGRLALATLIAAGACGWISWYLVEAPALRWLRRRTPVVRPIPQAVPAT